MGVGESQVGHILHASSVIFSIYMQERHNCPLELFCTVCKKLSHSHLIQQGAKLIVLGVHALLLSPARATQNNIVDMVIIWVLHCKDLQVIQVDLDLPSLLLVLVFQEVQLGHVVHPHHWGQCLPKSTTRPCI